jgi:hypothetical protein
MGQATWFNGRRRSTATEGAEMHIYQCRQQPGTPPLECTHRSTSLPDAVANLDSHAPRTGSGKIGDLLVVTFVPAVTARRRRDAVAANDVETVRQIDASIAARRGRGTFDGRNQ